MSRIKARVRRLEKRINAKRRPPPYVVSQREGESEEEAILRTYGDEMASETGCFILVPEVMSESAWEAQYSPSGH